MEVIKAEAAQLPAADQIRNLEERMLTNPLGPIIEGVTEHFFGPGVYIRQLTIPAGSLIVGHKHKYSHVFQLIQGDIAQLTPGEEKVHILSAPLCVVAPPGQKVGYALNDVILQNIYATDETDLEIIEEMFIEKSPARQNHHLHGYAPALVEEVNSNGIL